MLFRQLFDRESSTYTYLLADEATREALLIDTVGDPGQLYDSIAGRLFDLPDATLVFPAHDYRGRTVTTIGEEKRWNTRIAGRSRDEFIAVMKGLHLPEPARIREAVPANLGCGETAASPQG